MDPGITLVNENPKKNASILSKLCFAWMIGLYHKSVKYGLKVTDIYKTLDCDQSQKLGEELEKNWEKQVLKCKGTGKTPSLFKALMDTFLFNYMLIGVFIFIQFVGLKSFQPVVLSYLIRLFSNDQNTEDNSDEMYISGAILIAITILTIFFNHHCMGNQMAIGMRMRVAVSSLIYRKLLKLNKKALGETASGQVVNLMSNDVNRFDIVMVTLHHLWISPCLIAVLTYLVWEQIGVSCFAGVGAMIMLTTPLQVFLTKKSSSIRLTIAGRTDFRVRLMNEIISGIQVIKMYAWEKPFERLVQSARFKEIKAITVASHIRAILLTSMVLVERTALFFSIICYVLLGNVITADKVFSMQQFFNTLQLSLATFTPLALSLGSETLVSIRRLRNFLLLEEKQEALIEFNDSANELKIENVTAAWNDDRVTLSNLNLNVPAGSLCAIVGPVGAGKSSILQLLLGELPQKKGHVSINGSISYSSQEPWLFASSVRNNILFGQEYNKDHYKGVVKVCALETDFKQFPQGDKTKVGERGVSLSGGQRARINLARAIYRNADVYLLDDPLSAVDTHVGKHLFEKCIKTYLNGKTRILVTHQLQYLKKADIIVVINNGQIEAQGTFAELSKSNLDFTKMLVSADETNENEEGTIMYDRQTSIMSTKSIESSTEETPVETNEEEIGMKKGSAVKEYMKAGGGWCILGILVLILVTAQVAASGTDYWITYWTSQEAVKHDTKSTGTYFLDSVMHTIEDTILDHNDTRYVYSHESKGEPTASDEYLDTYMGIYIYTGLIVATISITVTRSFLFFNICMNASRNLHSTMFHSLLEAPMRFFDTNPSGRVLNRFSKDMGSIDEFLPRICLEAIQFMLVTLGILVIVSISNPYMVIAIVILGALFMLLRKWYLKTVKMVKHIEGITKSPVFSHINSTLNGITTIRSCNAEAALVKEFDHHQDVHTSAWFLTISSMISFGLWLDVICTIFITIITFSFIILHQFGSVNGSLVGLAISQSLILTGMLQYGIRQSAEAINQMTSVERVLQYTQIEKEGPFQTPKDNLPPKEWPSKGQITFKQMSLKYTVNDPPVLKELDLNVYPGEKIGIVGRTGAGKSSLISALFRLTLLDGQILLDDIDTKNIGLTDLRRRISIIPQEPVLFSETVRFNLDPFKEFGDSLLWNTLEEVELKSEVSSLNYKVDGGGANFSLGQRQLMCLARAIVRNNKVLILDEATANVDPRTDSLIQATIRRKFKKCTVLTIAHRLNTIMDSDRVLVLDAGRIIEFDHPHKLLQNTNGHFYKMVLQTGPTMTQQLLDIAEHAYNNKKP